jgi:hypothetical protein
MNKIKSFFGINIPSLAVQNKDLILIAVLSFVILLGLVWQGQNLKGTGAAVSIVTDKTEYGKTDFLKLAIKNNLPEKVCFSSCYPYYLEKKDGNSWDMYSYSQCDKSNVTDKCVDPHQSKFFQIDLNLLTAGIHRLIIPTCLNCKVQDNFRKDSEFYSNEFIVK